MSGGHGHVKPRPGGAKARCGGPALCSGCRAESAEWARPSLAPVFLPPPLPIDPECERGGCDCHDDSKQVAASPIPDDRLHGPGCQSFMGVLSVDPPRYTRIGCTCEAP